MQCREIANELDAYMTGELDSATTAQVERHLETCAACRAELELLRKENGIYREYASVIDIPDDIPQWTSVPHSMPESAIHWWRWAAAAAVLVAAILSWRIIVNRYDSGLEGDVSGGQITGIRVPVHQAVSSYEQALLLLQASYEGKKKNLDPTLAQELDRNLRVTGAAIAECKLALERHPDNEQVVEFLLLGYEKQVGILKQITEAL